MRVDQSAWSRGRGLGRGGRAAGGVVLVGAGGTGIGVAGVAHGVARQFERGKAGEMADLLRDDLVNRDAGANVRAGRFLHPNAGQERAAGARVIAGAIRTGGGVDMVQAAENLELMLHLRQRLHRTAQLEIFAFPLGPPRGLNGAIGEINVSHSQRRAAGGPRQVAHNAGLAAEEARWQQRFQSGQRDTRAESAEEAAPAQARIMLRGEVVGTIPFHGNTFISVRCSDRLRGSGPSGTLRIRRFWKGADSTMPSNNSAKRPFARSRRSTIRSTVSTS